MAHVSRFTAHVLADRVVPQTHLWYLWAMTFSPSGNEVLQLAGYTFQVRAHGGTGALARRPIRIVGGRAQVYQLIDTDTGDAYALKVMLPAFRKPQLLRNGALLRQLAPHPGFEACRQLYFTPESHPADMALFPDLAYASLMPWIQGQDWKAIIGNPEATIDADTTWEIAYQLVRLVRVLERNHIAHCDLSGGNVMVNLDTRRVHLIDFDEVYWPDAPLPAVLPTGTPGYRRRVESQWVESSDRFPMAVLVAEMLGWRDAAVRHNSSGDSFFTDEDCLGQDSGKYQLLEEFMYGLHSELGELLKRAWFAPAHAECPGPDEWRAAIIQARGWRSVPIDPLDRANVNLGALPSRGQGQVAQQAVASGLTSSEQQPQHPAVEKPAGSEPSLQTQGTVRDSAIPTNDLHPVEMHNVSTGQMEAASRRKAKAGISRSRPARVRRKVDLGNSIVIGIALLTIGVLLVGMFFLLFGGR